jgi:hypothetical protein
MAIPSELTTATILGAFANQLAECGGRVSERFDDGRRLFARGVLPRSGEVARRDRVQAGVAIRAMGEVIDVHPYLYRLVCKNGQIFVEATEPRRIDVPAWAPVEMVLDEVRLAVKLCAGEDAFAAAAGQMRRARGDADVNLMITLMPYLHHFAHWPQMLEQIVRQFTREHPSRFGLINAVTATARDGRDPEVKWRLEELGGQLAALERPVPAMPRSAARELAVV